MKKIHILFTALLSVMTFGLVQAQNVRTVENISKDWLFSPSDVADGSAPKLADNTWRHLDVPHDWSIEGHYDANNLSGRGGGFLPTGVVWYRKHLTLPASLHGKRLVIEFGGIMEKGEVWVNGKYKGLHPYAYTATTYDITDDVHLGGDNVIAVKANTSEQPASRWYTGTGIYRPVRLIITAPTHLDHWGVFYDTSDLTVQRAVVKVHATVINQGTDVAELTLVTTLTAPDGKTYRSAATPVAVAAGGSNEFVQTVEVSNPVLWDIDLPKLYAAKTELLSNGKAIDDRVQQIGLRICRWDAATGFWLNGRNIKLKGLCLHHDGGAVGAAVPMAVWERRIDHLKEVGGNAIRCAHNPQSDEFYSLCDRKGVLVMSESFDCWTVGKNPYDYSRSFRQWYERDLTTMVKMDRNHPCIVIRSMGNEIHDQLGDSASCVFFNTMKRITKTLDPTRPVTQAVFRPNVYHVYDNGFSELMDVVGQNYRENELAAAHAQKPTRIVLGTENRPERQAWLYLRDEPYLCGQFFWAGCDYLGESKGWPNVGYDIALFDRNAGFKPLAYEVKSWWSTDPMVHIVRYEDNAGEGALVEDWTPIDFGAYDQGVVNVYSNCEEVDLLLNGTSLGKKKVNADRTPLQWTVTYEKGAIEAVGYKGGQVVATQTYKTAGDAARVVLRAEKSTVHNNWDDVLYLGATVTDADGVRCPNGTHKLTFTVEGPGELVAVDNADVKNHEGYRGNVKSTYRGEALAIVRATAATGRIVVRVSSEGLQGGRASVDIR
jgi:beta-galactosidase